MADISTKIRAEVFAFCEYASFNNGRLNVQGTFDTWRGKKLPFNLPKFAIAVRLRLPEEKTSAKGHLTIIDPDGKLLTEPKLIEITKPVTTLVFTKTNVKLTKLGVYHAALMFDKEIIAALPLQATTPKNKPELTTSSSLN